MAAQLNFIKGRTQVGMTTDAAEQGVLSGQGHGARGHGVVLQGQDRALHLVGVALVIDKRMGPEFADAHEARPGDERAASHLLTAAGDVGHQRQAREVVARHEALAGQIAVRAEVVVVVAAAGFVGQQ